MQGRSASSNWLLQLTAGIGFVSQGLLVLVIVTQFAVILLRHVFGLNFIWAQESIGFGHAALVMLAFAWSLTNNRHVRVDVFFEKLKPKSRQTIDRLGIIFLVLPSMVVIILNSMGYVQSSWAIFEGSQEVSGLPGLFLMKSLLLVSAGLVFLAGMLRLFSSDLDEA